MRAILLVLAMLVVSGSAGADSAEDKKVAADAYREGTRLYDLADFASALELFKKAYLHYEDPAFLFNMAQCYRQLGDKQLAIATYRSYLRNVPNAANRADVERLIAELKAAIDRDRAKEANQRARQNVAPTVISPADNKGVVAVAQRKHNRAWIAGVVVGVVAIGLAVGLGVGLTVGRPTEPTLTKVTF